MKEIYSFTVEIEDANKTAPKKGKSKHKQRIVFAKASMQMIEEAEFFYGQKFNEYINAGFLTKAMLSKKMGDIGGFSSKATIESLQKAISENIEASRVIEFYGGSETLSDEQKEKLDAAKETFAATRVQVLDYEQSLRSQFSQTADVKAEQKLIEWFVFNLAHYEDSVDGNSQLFPLFEGETFDEKREIYLQLCEKMEDIDDVSLHKTKKIFDAGFTTLVRVASIWYNKIAEKPEDIEKVMKEMFADDATESGQS